MSFILRKAVISDRSALKALIEKSSKVLQKNIYTDEQITAALGPVFGVDEQMIHDATYFVVEFENKIVGCGGWSFREALYGGQSVGDAESGCLNPKYDAARIRAFFVDPDFARRGIGSLIMESCERAIRVKGFRQGQITATLAGEPFYRKFGYITTHYDEIKLPDLQSMKSVCMIKEYARES